VHPSIRPGGSCWNVASVRAGELFAALLGRRSPARVLLEASTESEWVARALEALGHEVIVADPNFAPMYATRSRRVKTDRRDARTLADACRLGAYRRVHRTSAAQRVVRAQLAVREALVQTRTRYINVVRAVLRQDGVRIPSGGAATFAPRVQALALTATQAAVVASLLQVLDPLHRELAAGAVRLAARRGKQRAIVALACRLSRVLYAVWRDGSTFTPRPALAPADS
jgi:transposase